MKKIDILLIEDNPGDIRLTKEALKESKMKVNLHVVMDGVEGCDFLKKKENFVNAPTPDLIILDLNLPKKDGREVLRLIKLDKSLLVIPVIVLTTSSSEQDVLKSYGLHANCYVTKPLDFDSFVEIVKKIGDFWFTIVKLPNH
jgi:two-component system response regulator